MLGFRCISIEQVHRFSNSGHFEIYSSMVHAEDKLRAHDEASAVSFRLVAVVELFIKVTNFGKSWL